MNKKELCACVAEQTRLSKKETEQVLNCFLETITGALCSGERVQLVGFGAFEVRERAARMGRDIQRGTLIPVAPTRAVQFRASQNLKELIRKSGTDRVQ